jgi:2',3'-cyclic-nucleotide 2'-phosphodiesterase (5'-nucleotidase family)
VDELLAAEVEGIDLIIGGHSHDLMSRKIGRTSMVQALSDGATLGEVKLMVENGQVSSIEPSHHILWNDQYEPEEKIERMIEALRTPHREQLQEIIATATQPIGRQYKSESPFDKLVADLLCQRAKAQIAILPGVGYGVSLQPGPITREALYTLLPHPSEVVTLTLKGSQILEILEQSGTNQKPRDPFDAVGGLIQTSGIRWTIDLTRPSGQRIRDVHVGVEPLGPDRVYSVATHSGMVSGTHRYSAFARGGDIRKEDLKLVELVEERMRAMGRVRPPAMGDVTLIQ